MIRQQIEARGIHDPRVLGAFAAIDRKLFVPLNKQDGAYEDHPLPIGDGQTISQPYMVAEMTELLNLSSDDRVLEIGTGSGYQTAILSKLAKEVYTIEVIPRLSELAREKLEEIGVENVYYRVGNGFHGWPEFAPYNAIIVTAAPGDIPEKLVEQLADGGRMIVPVGKPFHVQTLYLIRKEGEDIDIRHRGAVAFVPMVRSSKSEDKK